MQGTESSSWLRGILRRYGVVAVTLGATLLSIILSIVIMTLLSELAGDPITGESLVISTLAPAIIAPLLSFNSFKILAQLDEAERRLKTLSTLDELTGAFNRRHFMELALYELENAERYAGHLSIAILDFDNFKLINDRFGHLAGDQALRVVSRICRETIRRTDIFARYGGDEFVFLFPQTAGSEALESLERVIERISAFSFESQGRTVGPRVSIGVHSFGPKSRTLDTILEKADLALYKSKQMGGSRVSG